MSLIAVGWLYRQYPGAVNISFSIVKPRLSCSGNDEYRCYRKDGTDGSSINPFSWGSNLSTRIKTHLNAKAFKNFKYEDGPKRVAIIILEDPDGLIEDINNKMCIKTSTPEREGNWIDD